MSAPDPRCARPLQRNLRTDTLEPGVPLCGRPEGHHGHCLSEAAWRRKLDANRRGVEAARQRAGLEAAA